MGALIDYARARDVGELFGTVLHENRAMLDLAERLGFSVQPEAGASDAVELRLRLRDQAA
jgi:acetyltransferase